MGEEDGKTDGDLIMGDEGTTVGDEGIVVGDEGTTEPEGDERCWEYGEREATEGSGMDNDVGRETRGDEGPCSSRRIALASSGLGETTDLSTPSISSTSSPVSW